MSEDSLSPGEVSRRGFLLLAASALTAGCESTASHTGAAGSGGAGHVVDAGPAAQVGAGVSKAHENQGFFLTHRDGKVVAISSYCTHRRCQLEPQANGSFHCPCHGSDFSSTGKVIHGPATRDLPVFPCTVDGRGHVMVTVTG
jgi:Rieske Fe-S protein